ncbi:MAG: ATP-binding cassette domain-containing protein [Clostridia bacterium]|nr:ATP-binding cassette domain-containing protein [Clostridia bacterium]
MLISLDNAAFSYGDNLIFSGVTFSINEGERVGLIGANGEGKTTLIRLITGEFQTDAGTVVKKNGIKIGCLEQSGGYTCGNTVYGEMLAIFNEELSAVQKLSSLSEELSKTDYTSREYNALSAKIESLNKYISANDCFNVEVKIKTVLNGLGFADRYNQVIDTMSGGEKTRLKLARLLLENPDLLILDEPTNHLDIPTLFWLEEYLQTFKGAIFVVSHDRFFLDKITRRTLELENKKLLSFAGNYSKYKILKAELCERLQKEYEAQLEERAKLQNYVDRNLARASTAKSAQSRVKQLEKMDLVEKPFIPPKPPRFVFNYDAEPYENALEIKNLNLERGGKQLLKGANLLVKRGEKVAVVGENGTGKSTLLKEILSGNTAITKGRLVRFAYFDQESANLNAENTVLSELWERHTGYTQTEARAALARCGLFAEDADKKVKSLSGGERAKLALCILECERGNFLLMDEPTNHLDLPAREGLEKSLKEFDGTLIFVSHDRYFISALAQNVCEISDGGLKTYFGGYENYLSEKQKTADAKKQAEFAEKQKTAQAERESSYRSKKERAEEERKKQLAKQIEREITQLEKEEDEINSKLALPDVAADYLKVQELLSKLEGIKLQLDTLYKRYETVL